MYVESSSLPYNVSVNGTMAWPDPDNTVGAFCAGLMCHGLQLNDPEHQIWAYSEERYSPGMACARTSMCKLSGLCRSGCPDTSPGLLWYRVDACRQVTGSFSLSTRLWLILIQ
jgi:hypothetical protein